MEDDHTPVVLDFVKDFECLWNTNSEHYGKTELLKLQHMKMCS
jgi:hypothetical protein